MSRLRRVVVIAALGLLVACSASPTPEVAERRVAVLAPAVAEMLVALELEQHIVAIGDAGPWPDALESLPSAGRFDQVSLERLLEWRVTDVATTRTVAAEAALTAVRQAGIRVVELDTDQFEGVLDGLMQLGEAFDRNQAAQQLAQQLRTALDRIAQDYAELPRRSTVVVVGREPLFVAGPGSHFDRLVSVGGGSNVFDDLASPYAQVSMEALLARGPEVILDCSGGGDAAARHWQRWTEIPAVAGGAVYGLDPALVSVPGIRLPEAAAAIARSIHPPASGSDDATP